MLMENKELQIDTLLLKRGTQKALETILAGDKKPKSGELIFELPSEVHPGGRLKIGDGINDYRSLAYIPDSIELNSVLNQMYIAASDSVTAKAAAESAAGDAILAANRAERAAEQVKDIPETTMNQVSDYMNKKLHFMSMTEYNSLTTLDPDGLYFVSIED